MSYEIHITRGGKFGSPGPDPITLQQWCQQVAACTEFAGKKASAFARLGGRPVVFNNGLVAATAPGTAELRTLTALATELRARLFGEDGTEYGFPNHDEVVLTILAVYPQLNTSSLTDSAAADLINVARPCAADLGREALLACRDLDGATAVAGLAYLLCRAVDSGGRPEPAVTCAVAHLLRHKPALLAGLQGENHKAWVTEVERLAKQVEKSPGSYVLRRCHDCNATNRIRLFTGTDQQPTCGRCKASLSLK